MLGWAFWMHEGLGEQEQAEELGARRAMEAAERTGDAGLLCRAAGSLAGSLGMRGDVRASLGLHLEAVAHARRSADARLLSAALANLANVYEDLGNYQASRETNEEALALDRQLGDVSAAAHTEQNLAHILLFLDEFDEARRPLSTALPVLHEHGMHEVVGWAFFGFALIALRDGEIERPTRLCAARQALHERIGYVPRPALRESVEHLIEPITSRRGEPAIDKAWAEGEAMTVDEAVAYALADES